MQNLETIKNRGQETFGNLVERSKTQSGQLKTWGVTAATAVVGAATLPAIANGALFILGGLATPPIAMTLGAIGGGAIGWRYMQQHTQADDAQTDAEPVAPETVSGVETASAADMPAESADPSI